jgi:hypothetical protein
MQKFHTYLLRRVFLLILALLLLALCSSCNMMQLPAFPLPAENSQAFAEQLFLNGDFKTALLEYERLYDSALSAEAENHALYGLACTQMMLADNEEQFIEAIGNLQKWNAGKGTAPFRENRLLLVLSLKQQSKRIAENKKERIARETAQISLIDDQKKKISEMMSTVSMLHTQIEELNNQIAALEAIDENVQEKQNSL